MDTSLAILLFLVLLALGYITYRYARLRRAVRDYTILLRRAVVKDLPASALPGDVPDLEDTSNAVNALLSAASAELEGVDADRARLATVLEQLTDGVLIVDAGGRIQFANPAAERLFGENLPGRSVAQALRQHQLVEAWRKCQQTGEMQSESVELPAKRQFLQLVAIPDSHASGSLLLVQDLTRVRRLETVRRDFISNVSHELRTPLASLRALTETLQDGALEDPEASRRFLGRIITEVDALSQMASELLELTRIESGQVPLELCSAAPEDLLNAAVERMRAQAERAAIHLNVNVSPDLPAVRVDAPRLGQVLVNLVHNAIKFTPPDGSVTLSAERDGNFVRFSVRDTGTGIPAESLPRIFERFYRVDRSRTGGGTGLGLSIARHLVEAHGGRIWAESEEGRGSTFYFTIPVSKN